MSPFRRTAAGCLSKGIKPGKAPKKGKPLRLLLPLAPPFLVLLLLLPSGCLTTETGTGETEAPSPDESAEKAAETADKPKTSRLNTLIGENNISELEKLLKVDVDVNKQDSSGQTPLHHAVENQSLRIIKLLLLQGADPSIQDSRGATPLHIAVKTNQDKAVRLLAEAGGPFLLTDGRGESPLSLALRNNPSLVEPLVPPSRIAEEDSQGSRAIHYAAEMGNPESAGVLLDKGADVNARNLEGKTPLDLCLAFRESRDHAETAFFLIRRGARRMPNSPWEYLFQLVPGKKWNTRFSYGNTAMHLAASRGHLGILKYLLEQEADPNLRNNPGSTPLHEAVRANELEAVQILIDAGGEVNATDYNQNTPLHTALSPGAELAIAEYLLQEGAEADAKNHYGNTPLHLTIMRNLPVHFAEKLIQAGADVNSRNKTGNTPLFEAVKQNIQPVAQMLISHEADLFARNNGGDTPMTLALSSGSEVVDWFLAEENINIRDNEGNTPLHLALQIDADQEVLMLLLARGANPNARNRRGSSPLHTAVNRERIPAVSLILDKGGDLFISNNEGETPLLLAFRKGSAFVESFMDQAALQSRDNRGNTPLFHAVSWDFPEMARLLIQLGSDVNTQNTNGAAPLHQAVRSESPVSAALLLEQGADLYARDNLGNTPLHDTVKWQTREIASILLDNGADINTKNMNGNTPLHEAAAQGKQSMTAFFLQHGASPDIRNSIGNTPLHEAAGERHSGSAAVLLDRGADLSARNTDGHSALQLAVQSGAPDIIRLLLQGGADIFAENRHEETPLSLAMEGGAAQLKWVVTRDTVNRSDNRGQTPLHSAVVEKADPAIIKELIEMGARINARNSNGDTPLMIALSMKAEETAKILLEAGADTSGTRLDSPGDDGPSSSLVHDVLHKGDKHLQGVVVETALGDDQIGIGFGRLNEFIVAGTHHLQVLLHHRLRGTSPLHDVPLHPADKPDIIRGVHKDLQINQIPDPFVKENHNPLKDDQPFGLQTNGLLPAAVVDKVILRHFHRLPLLQPAQMVLHQQGIKGLGMIKIEGRDIGIADELSRLIVVVLGDKNKIRDNLRDLPDNGSLSGTGTSGNADQLDRLTAEIPIHSP